MTESDTYHEHNDPLSEAASAWEVLLRVGDKKLVNTGHFRTNSKQRHKREIFAIFQSIQRLFTRGVDWPITSFVTHPLPKLTSALNVYTYANIYTNITTFVCKHTYSHS